MSSVEALGAEDAPTYAKRMKEWECRGWGDEDRALRSIGRRCRMSARSVLRLIKGERKDGGLRVLPQVRAAYLDYCAEQVRKFEAAIEADRRAYGDDAVADLAGEIEAIRAKLDAARKTRA